MSISGNDLWISSGILGWAAAPTPPKGNQATPATVGLAAVAQQFSATTASGSGSSLEARALEATPTLLREGTNQFQRADMEGVELPAVLRATTPPPFTVEGPVTPKKGKKRMAKEDCWKPSKEEVEKYILDLNLCALCWREGHNGETCPFFGGQFDMGRVMSHPKFQPYLRRWQQNRKKRGSNWILEDQATEAIVAIPPFCTACKAPGHMSDDVECPGK
ncbi:7314_t:CDS:2 [Paraglomus brasilianum]|uniref:7314_t:CDS:1 n=1 Tax=Paraglomus brasilianum TaxID=144538 RepID=A0A9N9CB66_9GLOM|nr:7314_t:CDS:2 [Paraglomus brasilianum]